MTAADWLFAAGAALAAGIIVAGWRAGAVRAAAWGAAAVAGQVGSLALVRAGPRVGYQHLVGLGEALRDRRPAVALSLLVLAAAVFGMVTRRRSIARWLRSRAMPWAIAASVLAGSLLAAAPSASARVYASELALAAVLQLAVLSCAAFAAMELPDEYVSRVDSWIARFLAPRDGPPRLDTVSWAFAGFVTVVSASLCLASYEGIPHIPDEIAYLIQARYFALGQPWMAPPTVPAAFDTFLLEVSGDHWYSVFPPGWPLVLALGVKAGVPFLVNPVLGGACVLLAYLLVQEWSDRGTARLSALLLAVSPWHLLMSMNFMSHVLSLALALVTALGVARTLRTGSWISAVVAGLSLGALGMSRPLEGVAVALLVGGPLLRAPAPRGGARALLAAAAGTLVTGGLGLLYNRAITGSPFVFPAERFFDRVYGAGRYSIGFGPEKGLGWTGLDPFPGHGLIDVAVNTVLNGFMINVDLFGWATGSVAVVMLGVLAARKGVDRWMVVAITLIVVLHGAFWFSGGPDFGARYWYLVIVPSAFLAVRGLASVEGAGAFPRARTVTAAALLCLSAMVLFVPWRAIDKYPHYRGVRGDPVRMKHEARYRDGLILVQGESHPDWAAAAIANDVPIGRSSAPIFAWDRNAVTRQAVLRAYPARTVWIVQGPSLTGRGFEILQGPVLPDERASLNPP